MSRGAKEQQGKITNNNGREDVTLIAVNNNQAQNNKNNQQQSESNAIWTLDSGCTHHYCKNPLLLTDLHAAPPDTVVTTADGSRVRITTVGTATLRSDDQRPALVLKDVRLVPSFTHNLLSVRGITKEGEGNNNMQIRFTKERATVSNQGRNILTAQQHNGLYLIQQPPPAQSAPSQSPDQCMQASPSDPSSARSVKTNLDILHYRLGHLSWYTVLHMLDNNAVDGLDCAAIKIKLAHMQGPHKLNAQAICEPCAMGKGHRRAFKTYSLRPKAKKVLECISADVCGPIDVPDSDSYAHITDVLGPTRYMSLIVDEFSRYMSASLLKSKDGAKDHVMAFVINAETLTAEKVKTILTDDGGEYRDSTLRKFCSGKGIKMEHTTVNTPQHNARTERANRTIFEMSRAMLFHAKLPLVFWGHAVLTAVYLLNRRVAPRNNKDKTPLELWAGVKPDLSTLRVWGCDAYVHPTQDPSKLKKLDSRALKCIFLGYSSDAVNGYVFYEPTARKTLTRRDAIFDEETFSVDRPILSPNGQDDPDLTQSFLDFNRIFFPSQPEEAEGRREAQGLRRSSRIRHKPAGDGRIDERDLYYEDRHSAFHDALLALSVLGSDMLEEDSEEQGETLQVFPESGVLAQAQAQARSDVPSRLPSLPDPDPATYSEAMSLPDADKWRKALDEEMTSIKANHTWELVDLPPGKRPIGCKWVFKKKMNAEGKVERYKARLCAKGFSQRAGVDYNETFAPVLKYKSLRILLHLANMWDYETEQMDVMTAFLYGYIKEEVYMQQPEGYEHVEQHKGAGAPKVCRLIKTLYGTKQAPREWNAELNSFLTQRLKMKRFLSDSCVYARLSSSGRVIVIGVFVDDMLCLYHKADKEEWTQVKSLFQGRFKVKELGEVKWILGMQVRRTRAKERNKEASIIIDQHQYLNKVLETHDMLHCNPSPTPEDKVKLRAESSPNTPEEQAEMCDVPYRSVVGSLLYASLGTRPDITHAVAEASRFLSNPGQVHWTAVKRVCRFLRGSNPRPLVYHTTCVADVGNYIPHIVAYSDADWAGDPDTRKSTTGYLVKLDGDLVSWASRRQPTVTTSSAEAEYMAITEVAKEVIWIRQLMSELLAVLHQSQARSRSVRLPPATIWTDNQAAKSISENDTFHSRTKHIDIRHRFIQQGIAQGEYKVQWLPTEEQQADMLTKALDRSTFTYLTTKAMTGE